jgi:hypothetical protein
VGERLWRLWIRKWWCRSEEWEKVVVLVVHGNETRKRKENTRQRKAKG